MRNLSQIRRAALALTFCALTAGTAVGQQIYGLSTAGNLVSFAAATPNVYTSNVAISGVTAGETLVGMDFRPATGELFALGYDQTTSTATLYTLNLTTAVATVVGSSGFALVLGAESAANVGFDFNPTVDRIRVVSADINANYRLNPFNGMTLPVTDGSLAYNPSDSNAGRNPQVGAVAYSNSYLGALSTVLYAADLVPNTPSPGNTAVILAIQSPPNAGVLNTLNTGTQPQNLQQIDMDVYTDLPTGTQTAYVSAVYQPVPGTFLNAFSTTDLATGVITLVGSIGPTPVSADPVVDIAAQIDRTVPAVVGQIAWALAANKSFVTFDTGNPNFIRGVLPITGVTEPQIVGFDSRPATGQLFAMGYDLATESARLYTIDRSTGVATAIGAGPVVLTGLGTGPIAFDFNPTVDRIRVESASNKNFRLNPNDGTIAAFDGDLAYALADAQFGTDPTVGSAAYTSSFNGTTTTTLYTIDEALGQLNSQIPPNAGTQNTIGSLGLTFNPSDPSLDLDIYYNAGSPGVNTAYLLANVGSSFDDNLYTVNLATGNTSLVGRIGGGIQLTDLAVRLPGAAIWTGTVSTDYNTAGNWSNGQIPSALTPVIIASEPMNQPTLTGSGGANMLTINAGATLTLAAGADLTLNGNLTNNGTLTSAPDAVVMAVKPTVQTFGGSSATTLGSLEVNSGGVTLVGQATSIQQMLTLRGNLITSGIPLTMLSNATGTAMVVNDGASVVTGDVTVQRYITPGAVAGLGYRHLSAPVSTTTVADLAAPGFVPVVNGAYNGPANPANVRPYPNVFGYDETRFPASNNFGQGYFSPTSQASPLVSGLGYSVYMKGTVKPDFVGTLGNGDVALSLTKTGNFLGSSEKSGWHLLGNPYPAPIDWDLVTVPAGMSPTISVFRTSGGNNGTYTQYINGVGPAGTDLLPMGQAFFARYTGAGSVSFMFQNSNRLTQYANPVHYRQAADARPTLHLTLSLAGLPAEATDAAYVYFQDGATAANDLAFDAQKMRAEGEVPSVFTLTRGTELAINGLPADQAGAATVALGVVLPVAGTYSFDAALLRGFAPGTNVVLIDRLTNTEYDLTTQPTVTFPVTTPGTSLTRFSLRFGRGGAGQPATAATASLDVFPNPATAASLLNVNLDGLTGETATATLFDVLGRPVATVTLPLTDQRAAGSLDVRHVARGTYTLRVTSAADATGLTRQVVVQ